MTEKIVNKKQLVMKPRAITHERLVSEVKSNLKSVGVLVSDVLVDIIIDSYLTTASDYIKTARKVDIDHIGRIYASYKKKPDKMPFDDREYNKAYPIVPLVKVQNINNDIKEAIVEGYNVEPDKWKR